MGLALTLELELEGEKKRCRLRPEKLTVNRLNLAAVNLLPLSARRGALAGW
jgi:hypothetical protein